MGFLSTLVGNVGEASYSALVSVVGFMVSWLPDSTGFPADFAASFNSLVSSVYAFEFLFPVRTLIELLQLAVPLNFAVLLFRAVNWAWNKFRGAA